MAFRFDKLTVKGQEAVQRAQQLAEDRGNSQLTALHLLAALLDEQEGIIRPLVQKIGATAQQLHSAALVEIDRLPKVSGAGGQLSMASDLNQVFDKAQKLAEGMKDAFVSTEHLLMGLVGVDSSARKLLNLHGVGEHDILESLKSIRGGQSVTDQKRTSTRRCSGMARTSSNSQSRGKSTQ